MFVRLARLLGLSFVIASPAAFAATLPEHEALDVLVLSDQVNPHGLSPAELTQPGDISAALNQPDSGLNLAAPAVEVSSQCVDDALAALTGAAPPDVVVYFAHQAALGCDASDQQPALFSALQAHLVAGGGIVVFHHGSYVAGGKEALLELVGVQASSIEWNTGEGQRVFDVAPGHFVSNNGLSYTASAELAGSGSVPSGTFDYFDNVPDERYPITLELVEDGEQRTMLFATSSGGARVLGYALERDGWSGRVVFYQPGEYQPNALDDLDGQNFQILANAIVYSARREPVGGSAGEPSGGGNTSGGNTSGATGTGGAMSSGAASGNSSLGGDEGAGAADSDSGCGCTIPGTNPGDFRAALLFGLLFLRRTRSRRRASAADERMKHPERC
jgi:hypothetical protein